MLFLLVYQFAFSQLLALAQRGLAAVAPGFPFLLIVRSPGGMILLQLCALLLPLAIWLAFKKESLRMHLPNSKLGRKNVIMIIGITFLLLPFMAIFSGLATLFFPNPVADLLGDVAAHPLWALLLAVAVTPAIVEETVFRGYIQSQYPGRAFWQVALINGLFFGIIHLNPQQFLYAFVMGVILAYMVYYTRSIRAAIISHFMINAVNIALFRFATWFLAVTEAFMYETGNLEALATLEEAAEASPWAGILTVSVVALVFLPFLILLSRAFIAHNNARFH
jgi:hypothetical protein